MRAGRSSPTPFALSLSKGFPSMAAREVEGFDKLSPNGFLRTDFTSVSRP